MEALSHVAPHGRCARLRWLTTGTRNSCVVLGTADTTLDDHKESNHARSNIRQSHRAGPFKTSDRVSRAIQLRPQNELVNTVINRYGSQKSVASTPEVVRTIVSRLSEACVPNYT